MIDADRIRTTSLKKNIWRYISILTSDLSLAYTLRELVQYRAYNNFIQ